MVEKEVPVLYKRKEECCGCTACYAICPKEAISMVEDEEGFVKTHTLRICPFVIHSKSGLLRTCSFRLSPSNDCVSMQVSLPVSPVAVRDSYRNLKTFLIIYSKNIQTFPAIA